MTTPVVKLELDVAKLLLDTPLYSPVPVDDMEKAVRSLLTFAGVIDTFCPGCSQTATFRGAVSHEATQAIKLDSAYLPINSRGGPTQSGLWSSSAFEKQLICTRKGHSFRFYFVSENRAVVKVGQFPSLADLETAGTEKYRKILGKDRVKELNRAIGLAAHGVGVGSYVYLRRIFESLVEEARYRATKDTESWNEAEYQRLRTAEKVAILKTYLPPFLAENPRLYSILSLGIHELTEEACLANFEALRLCIHVILDEKLREMERIEQSEAARKALARIGQ